MKIALSLCIVVYSMQASTDIEGNLEAKIYEKMYRESGMKLTEAEKSAHRGAFKSAISRSNSSQSDALEMYRWSRPALIQSIVDEVNSRDERTWAASVEIERFNGATLGAAKRQCGTVLNSPRRRELPQVTYSEMDDTLIPNSFDSRRDFGQECASLIGTARDQSNCGSCWSFSTTTALEDRLCLSSKGSDSSRLKLSPLDTLSCCNSEAGCNSFGCDGGDPASAWEWFVQSGVVSGGDYGNKETCKPYAFPSCAHHVKVPDMKPCSGDSEYSTPICELRCSNEQYRNASYEGDKHKSLTAYTVKGDEKSIKIEIMKHGPVSAAFMVYEDFLTYTGGIYHHITGQAIGGHAVKLIGWGEEKGVKYWLLLNSWNPSWGEQGAFRMKLNEGGIMDEITAGKVHQTEQLVLPSFETI